MKRTACNLIALAILGLATTGCEDPYARKETPAAPGPRTAAVPTPGDTSRPGPAAGRVPPAAATAPHSARAAATAFAERWVNWDWRSLAAQQRALARLARGDLRAQLRANATQARGDASLDRDKPGSRGTIAAINLRARVGQAAGILVTRERTYTAGHADLGGRRYRVYVVRLVGGREGWGVSAWEPQP